MKQAICYKCGKDLNSQVPDDAGEVTCFACDNPAECYIPPAPWEAIPEVGGKSPGWAIRARIGTPR